MADKEEKKAKKKKISVVGADDDGGKKKKKDKDDISEGGSKKKKKDKDDISDGGSKKKKKDKDEVSDGGSKKKKKDKDDVSDGGGKKKKKDKDDGSKKDKPDSESKTKKKKIATFESDEMSEGLELKKFTEVDRLRKSHYVREEKLKCLRAENATTDEVYTEMFAQDYDDKIEELEDEIKTLKRTLEKQKNTKKKLLPEHQLQLESDWLEVHIREWKFKIESLESKFELVKKAHRNAVEALQLAHVRATDKEEMEEMRQMLFNKKNDLFEATQLISELQKVAFTMLPPKVAKHCEEVEETMATSRKRLDEISYQSYRLKMENVSLRKELTALNTAIEGELEIEQILEKKCAQKQGELDAIIAKHSLLDNALTNGYYLLDSVGIAYEDAILKAAQMPAPPPLPVESIPDKKESKKEKEDKKDSKKEVKKEKEKEKKEKKEKPKTKKDSDSDTESKVGPMDRRKSVTVGLGEKMKFLNDKLKEVNVELEATKKEIAKTENETKAVMIEVKKVNDMKVEIDKLTKSKENICVQLQQEVVLRKTYYNQIEDLKGKIRVFSRCRPISKSELDRGNVQCVSFPDKYTVAIHGLTKDGKPREFQFDLVFPPETEQDDVFEDTSRLIQSAFDGFNVCIFAYGQTGSGKTHTLIGNLQKAPGIAPRSFVRLFEVVDEGKTKFSAIVNCYMLELYNEKLLDLMANNAEYSDKLEIKKDQHGMVIVPGAELLPARSGDELRDLFLKGNGNRHIASTKMNSESSRSHLIISMMVECTQHANGKIVRGKMSIIDLAGSERLAKSGVKGVGATEATAINMSLSALGDVISALTSGQPFIPYRNNKLTLLMQDSLGGNAKTLMFVNLSPVDYNATETCNSLVYAQRVKLIKNDATKVADTEEIPKLLVIIDKLQSGAVIEDFQAAA